MFNTLILNSKRDLTYFGHCVASITGFTLYHHVHRHKNRREIAFYFSPVFMSYTLYVRTYDLLV